MMENVIRLFILFMFLSVNLTGQALTKLTLEEAHKLLESNYPLLNNTSIRQEIYKNEMELSRISELPVINLKVDGRLQSHSTHLSSEVSQIPFEINQPLVSLRPYAEAEYTIFDGGITEAKRTISEKNLNYDLQQIEVQRFALRKQMNHLFLNVLIHQEQRIIIELVIDDLTAQIRTAADKVEFGVLLESELLALKAKELESRSQLSNIQFVTAGMLTTIAQLTGADLDSNIELVPPAFSSPDSIPPLLRPELQLYKLEKEKIAAKNELLIAERKPKLFAFAQAGVGYPNPLNILDNSVAPFGLIGAKLNWKILDWKKYEYDSKILDLNAQLVENTEESFKFNIENMDAQYLANVNRLREQMKFDLELVNLQKQILETYVIQLEEGIITSLDYIAQLNRKQKAEQSLLINKMELLKVQIDFWNERGQW